MVQSTKLLFPFLDFPEILNHDPEVKGNLVTVSWSRLVDCDVKNHILRYKYKNVEEWTEKTEQVPATEFKHTLKLKCHKVYLISVTARTAFGETPLTPGSWWKVKTGQGNYNWSYKVLIVYR